MKSSLDCFEITGDIAKCKDCGKEMERGLVNIATHWNECSGHEFYNALIEKRTFTGKPITFSEFNELINNTK